MGSSLMERGDRDRAIFCWKRTLSIDPTYLGVNERIARAYRISGDLKRARDWLLREVRNDPGNTDLLFEYGQLLVESGDVGTGAAKFAQIIELDPENIDAQFALGSIWLGLRQPERALACFEAIRVIDDDPDVPAFHLLLGEALMRLDRTEDARKELERASSDAPDSVHAAMLFGECHLKSGRAAMAADEFRRALAREEQNVFAHHKLGLSLLRLGQVQGGLAHCLRAVELQSDYAPAIHTAALAHIRMAHWRDARRLLRQARRTNPKDENIGRLLSGLWRHRLRHYSRGVRRVVARLTGRSE